MKFLFIACLALVMGFGVFGADRDDDVLENEVPRVLKIAQKRASATYWSLRRVWKEQLSTKEFDAKGPICELENNSTGLVICTVTWNDSHTGLRMTLNFDYIRNPQSRPKGVPWFVYLVSVEAIDI